MTILQSFQQLLQACELRWVYAGDLNWWLLFLSTATILFARRASQGNLISITMTVPTTYRRQFSHERQHPNSTLHTRVVVSSVSLRVPSLPSISSLSQALSLLVSMQFYPNYLITMTAHIARCPPSLTGSPSVPISGIQNTAPTNCSNLEKRCTLCFTMLSRNCLARAGFSSRPNLGTLDAVAKVWFALLDKYRLDSSLIRLKFL